MQLQNCNMIPLKYPILYTACFNTRDRGIILNAYKAFFIFTKLLKQ